MIGSAIRKRSYQLVEFQPGESFGAYRRRLHKQRRQLRIDWAYEHPVRAVLRTLFAVAVGVLLVTAGAFLWWLMLLVGLPCLLWSEWREVRQDRRAWKESMCPIHARELGDSDYARD
jgi:hypothetical protein